MLKPLGNHVDIVMKRSRKAFASDQSISRNLQDNKIGFFNHQNAFLNNESCQLAINNGLIEIIIFELA